MKQFTAVRSVIFHRDKILIIRESMEYEGGTQKGKYDFPGGKIEPGERYENAVKRETFEETGLSVKVGKPFHVGEWRPEINNERIQIIGIFFECSLSGDSEVKLSSAHDVYEWIEPKEYKRYNLTKETECAFKAYLSK